MLTISIAITGWLLQIETLLSRKKTPIKQRIDFSAIDDDDDDDDDEFNFFDAVTESISNYPLHEYSNSQLTEKLVSGCHPEKD